MYFVNYNHLKDEVMSEIVALLSTNVDEKTMNSDGKRASNTILARGCLVAP